ncbi:hypothetical protein CYLTODRAFT_29559 [Cylindrobasidium torrendii FP15055 ss-10]|uniref:F-box domain-containing protein n=1 Tax=Cylindrobasidium torrendii FP15055 ss-10 TaxID=1314674 RepID=A0A0D7B7V1_9AGAR|nr:hypothetical protein CYLTODRAFT_29559 [Cylindrobasidium torrendii FP15055 ss-10]
MIAIAQPNQLPGNAYDSAYGPRPKRKSLLNILTKAMKRRPSEPPSPTSPTSPTLKSMLSLLQAGKLHTLSIELDPSHGRRSQGPFPSVLALTITFRNYPSLCDLASALTDFPNIRSLVLYADSMSLARAPTPAVHGLSTICSHLQEIRIHGWNDEIGEWAAQTSIGVEILEVQDLRGVSRATPNMQRTVQLLLDVNSETLHAFKLSTFYQIHVDLERLVHLANLQISVSPTNGGELAAEAVVKTIRLWQPCHTQFIRLALVDEDGQQVDPAFVMVHNGMKIVELPAARAY